MESQNADGLPAAAWYPDPCARHESRYWDGAAWTDNVADGGQVSVDAVDAGDSETVLVVLSRVTDPAWGGFANAYLTERRLVVEQVLGTGATMGAVAAGGLVGLTLARNAAEKRRSDESNGQIGTIDDILMSSNKAYAINYADISEIVLTKKALPIGYSRCKIRSAQKDVTLAFKRDMFDAASTVLIEMLPGRVKVK